MDNKLSQNLIKDKMNKDFKENMDKIYSKLIAAKGKNFFSYISYSNRYSMLEIPNDTNLNERELTFINNKFYNNYFNNSITLIIYQSKAKIFSSKNKENLLKIIGEPEDGQNSIQVDILGEFFPKKTYIDSDSEFYISYEGIISLKENWIDFFEPDDNENEYDEIEEFPEEEEETNEELSTTESTTSKTNYFETESCSYENESSSSTDTNYDSEDSDTTN